MSQAINKDTEQYILNKSFDEDYQKLAVEILTENTAGDALTTQKEIATEETLQALLAASGGAYAIAYGKNVLDAGHYYTAYQTVGGTAWRIKRMNATTSSIEWASGADNLAAAWAAKTLQNYSYTI